MARAGGRELPASPVAVAGRIMLAITSLISRSDFWGAARFAEFGKQGADAAGDALVAVGLAVPAAFFGVAGQLPLDLQAFAQAWRVAVAL